MSAFDQIIGYENIKQELKWYGDILKNPKKYKALGVSGPSGLLLYGEPGVGKSMMAKALISESGCKAYTLRKNLPNGDFVKEFLMKLRKTLRQLSYWMMWTNLPIAITVTQMRRNMSQFKLAWTNVKGKMFLLLLLQMTDFICRIHCFVRDVSISVLKLVCLIGRKRSRSLIII